MAKALYGRMFSWIILRVNSLLAPKEQLQPSEFTEIGRCQSPQSVGFHLPLKYIYAKYLRKCQGVARVGPKGCALLKFEHFVSTAPRAKREKNLEFGHFTMTTAEPRG